MQVIPSLYVAQSSLGGKGVFTGAPIAKDSLIEMSPVIVMPKVDSLYLDETKLHDYYFIWGEKDQFCAIILGFGSMYNHAFKPNAQYQPDYHNETLDFYALRDIEAGEEITVNYNGDPNSKRDVWFRVREN